MNLILTKVDLENLLGCEVCVKEDKEAILKIKKLFFYENIKVYIQKVENGFLHFKLDDLSKKELINKKIIRNKPFIKFINYAPNILKVPYSNLPKYKKFLYKDIYVKNFYIKNESIYVLFEENENTIINDKEESFFSVIIKKTAMMNEITKKELKEEAQQFTLQDWKDIQKAKVGSVGFFTGLLGGPWGLALEAADIGYLSAILGRACYGIGHILGKKIDYEKDIENILIIWSGVGKGANAETLENNCVFVGENLIMKQGDLDTLIDEIDLEDLEGNFVNNKSVCGMIAGKAMAKFGTKGSVKVLTKISSGMIAAKIKNKILSKTFTKAASKLTSKLGTKMSTKWIPIIGGGASAAINIWVISSFLNAAEEYYKSDYILLNEN